MSEKMTYTPQKDLPLQRKPFTRWLFLGTLFSAFLASTCCWFPLLLLVLGLSTTGVAQTLEPLRPFFLGVTFILLAIAFYFTYRPQRPRLVSDGGQTVSDCCLPPPQAEQCCSPSGSSRIQCLQRGALWLITIAVLAFVFFPPYAEKLIGSDKVSSTPSYGALGRTVTFQVKGLTCVGCAIALRQQLSQVPGVKAVEVDFKTGKAQVTFEEGKKVSYSALSRAVKKAGYVPELPSGSNSRSKNVRKEE